MAGGTITLFEKKDPNKPGDKPAQGGGLFTKPPEEPKTDPKLQEDMENTINRLRMLEEKYSSLQQEVRVTEENILKRNRKLKTEMKTITSDILDLRRELHEVKEKVLLMAKEMGQYAKVGQVEVLTKYIDMWNPMNFVTHKELSEVIDEKLEEKGLNSQSGKKEVRGG